MSCLGSKAVCRFCITFVAKEAWSIRCAPWTEGTPLNEVWDGVKIADKTNIIKNLVEIEKKLLSVSFTRIALHRKN